jgi:hypothetical protein
MPLELDVLETSFDLVAPRLGPTASRLARGVGALIAAAAVLAFSSSDALAGQWMPSFALFREPPAGRRLFMLDDCDRPGPDPAVSRPAPFGLLSS